MSRTTTLSLMAGAAVSLAASGAALAESATPDGVSTDEIRAMVADMLADADTRSSLLQSGGTAGHDGHFFLASPDGAFRLNVGGQIQFRYIVNFRNNGNAIPGNQRDDFKSGFQTRRTKLVFDGNIYDDFFYKVQGVFNRGNNAATPGGFALEDAIFGYNFGNGWKVQAGQFKLPFTREELVSSRRQLAADRSFTDGLFSLARGQGVMVTYSAENWRSMVSFNDGGRTANTDFTTENVGLGGVRGGQSDFAFTGRFEYLGAGNWDQFKDFTSPRGSEGVAWMAGAAFHFQNGSSDSFLDNGGSILAWTADLSVEGDGWSAYGAIIGRHVNNEFTDVGSADEFGVVGQASYYLSDAIEPFVRYDGLIPNSGQSFNVLTFGANYYIHGHAAKFTLDAQWFANAPSRSGGFDRAGIGANTGIGFLGSGIEQDEIVIRAQFQLLF